MRVEKSKRARYTREFKQEAVRLVESGQSIAAAARSLELVEQTLYNWIKAQQQGKLLGSPEKPVSAEQMEISRLRAELARVKMERDILGKRRRTSPRKGSQVRLYRRSSAGVADPHSMSRAGRQRPWLLRALGTPDTDGGSSSSKRRGVGGADTSRLPGASRSLWVAAYLAATVRPRRPRRQGAGATVDAATRHSSTRHTAVSPGHHQ